MKKIKNLCVDIKNTFYNPVFYSNTAHVRLRKPIGLLIFTAFLVSIYFMVQFLFFGHGVIKEIKTGTFINYFPAELEITIENGIATSNVEEPYYIVSLSEADTEGLKEHKDNIVVIDTSNDASLSEIRNTNAYAVVGRNAITMNDQGEFRTIFYTDIFSEDDFVIHQELLRSWLEAVKGYLIPALYILSGIGLVIITVFFTVLTLIMAFIFSLVTLLIMVLRNHQMKYGQIYKITVYGMIPVMIINIFFATPVLVQLIMFAIILCANIKKNIDTLPHSQNS